MFQPALNFFSKELVTTIKLKCKNGMGVSWSEDRKSLCDMTANATPHVGKTCILAEYCNDEKSGYTKTQTDDIITPLSCCPDPVPSSLAM